MPSSSAENGNGARRVVPAKFAHAVLATKQFQAMVDWYKTVLQAEVVHSNGMLAFMTYDDEHHRIAIAAVPGLEDKPCHSVGLDHLAYTYANLGDLVFTYERLKQAGIMPVVTINHGPTTSMYYRDPDGNRVELQIDNFDSVEELKGFFQSDAMQKNPMRPLSRVAWVKRQKSALYGSYRRLFSDTVAHLQHSLSNIMQRTRAPGSSPQRRKLLISDTLPSR